MTASYRDLKTYVEAPEASAENLGKTVHFRQITSLEVDAAITRALELKKYQ